MTIDERLEALAQTVGLMASMQVASEKRMEEGFKRVDEGLRQTARNFETVLESIKRLENIAVALLDSHEDHEQRLQRLEKRRRP